MTPTPLLRAAALSALLSVLSWPAAAAWSPERAALRAAQPAEAAWTQRLIVKYRTQAQPDGERSAAAMRVAANRQGVNLAVLKRTATGAQVYRLSRAMTQDEARLMAAQIAGADPSVEYAEPDRLLHPLGLTNDSQLAQQWSLADGSGGIRATTAWNTSTGKGVVVAVIDSGVRPHADLAANLLPGYDFIIDGKIAGDGGGRDADAYDPGDAVADGYCGTGETASNSSWHGTHVAGIVAAVGNNGTGVAGIAHGAKVLPLRALGKCGGYSSDIADAMVWAAGGNVAGVPANAHPARVINLSLGGTGACDRTSQAAIDSARARGAVVVVAAGNESADAATSSPANCAGVISVAATNKAGGKASYSNSGAGVTLAAPGGDSGGAILSTLNAGASAPGADSYAYYAGTSMAAPAVSGVVALMLSANPALTPDQVKATLTATARAFPAACSGCGAGIVDAAAAVAKASGSATLAPPPAPAPTPPLAAVAEIESNNTLATAQAVATLPSTVAGKLSSTTDLDHFKVTLPAGKTLTATLTAGSTSAFGLNAYSITGKLISSVAGTATNAIRTMRISNSGNAAATLILRVSRTSGAAGSYQLDLGL